MDYRFALRRALRQALRQALRLVSCCVAAATLAGPVAFAQERTRVIEEVLVTAEKREASVQEIPIAITAYGYEDLELRGIDEIEGLQFSAPNLVISDNSQSPVTYAYIRAIGSDQLVAGFDPGVAYHFDGIYVGQPSSMPVDLWDMERVEVLRGPQGTLYGRNTTGGAINVITKSPTDDLEGTIDLTAGNYDRKRVRGALSGPLLEDRMNGRVAFIYDDSDGYQTNYIGDDGDSIDHWALRGKLDIQITDAASLMLTAQRFENKGNQGQKRREPFAPVEIAPGFFIDPYAGAIPNPTNPREVAKDHKEKLDLDNTLLSARLDWDLGPVTLVSLTGYIDNNWNQTMDIDMSSNPAQYQDWNMDTDQFTQELQLISNASGPFEWIAGVFYFDEHLDTDYYFEDSNPIAGFHFYNGGKLDTKSWAAYGQASYDFRPSGKPFRIVAGGRYTEDQKDIDEYQIIPEFLVDRSGSDDDSWDQWTGKLDVDWFVTESIMSYATYSHGYKGGGYSIGQFDNFDPEKVDSYELGLKSEFWDQRARVNVSAFYNDYKDLQVNFLVFTLFTTDNAAEATIKGIEVESTFLLTDELMVGVMGTWLSAEFDNYILDPGPPEVDLSGDTLNRAPKYTYALTAQYEFPMGDKGTFTARSDYYWQDDVYYRVQNIDRHKAGDFFTWDARLVWDSANQHYTIDAFIKNITDEDNQRGLTVSDGLSTGSNSFISYYPPRTYGLRVAYHFGDWR